MSEIKKPDTWAEGRRKIDWVRANMPLLNRIEKKFKEERPFEGLKIALSIHLEAKTAYLCETLAAGGAQMYITGSNPLSTQDDVAAALVHEGLEVFAWYGCSEQEYMDNIRKVVSCGPNIIIDDGGDLVHTLHAEMPELIPGIIGGCEETTTGVMRRYGTGQSVWNGINRTTNLIVAGKNVVVAGYGWCGKGVAMRAKGLGASVIVTEIDPVKAIEAVMDGFKVMPMDRAAEIGDIFVTVTGCKDVITPAHFLKMKDGAICCNAHGIRNMAVESWEARNNIMGYRLSNGRSVFILSEGRLVNLASGDGHPAEIMDMSFAIQALSARYLVLHRGEDMPRIISVPEEIDSEVARMKLESWGTGIDTLTQEQHDYLYGGH